MSFVYGSCPKNIIYVERGGIIYRATVLNLRDTTEGIESNEESERFEGSFLMKRG